MAATDEVQYHYRIFTNYYGYYRWSRNCYRSGALSSTWF